ncbi:MAG: hypothetical protein ABFR97_02880 [Thermodesulfobacteriota bacterium]
MLKKYMKFIAILSVPATLIACGGSSSNPSGSSGYDNNTLVGSWIGVPVGQDITTFTPKNFTMVNNSAGEVSEFNGIHFDSPAGTYNVFTTDGTLAMELNQGVDTFYGAGQLTSSTFGGITIEGSEFAIAKVTNIGYLEDTWTGTIIDNGADNADAADDTSYDVTVTIDSSGQITSFTGRNGDVLPFTNVSGRMYCQEMDITGVPAGVSAGTAITDASNAFSDIVFSGVCSPVHMEGTFAYDDGGDNDPDGTWTLLKPI